MSYDVTKLVKLGALKQLSLRMKDSCATKAEVQAVSDALGALKLSDLTNDAGFQTESQVAAAVAAADHLKRKITASLEEIDPAAQDAGQYLYLVPRADAQEGSGYGEYLVIDGSVEKVGDWSVDLSGYATKEELAAAAPPVASDEEIAEMLDEVFGTVQP